jgi:hypothetical protein
MGGERRGERKAVSFPATVSAGGRSVRDVVSDVSPTGLYLAADRHRFRPGERVRVSFSLPVGGRLVPVTVEGRVARVVRDALHRTRGIGVALLSPPAAALETIEAYRRAQDSATLGHPAGVAPARPDPSRGPVDRRLEAPADDEDGPTDPGVPRFDDV